MSMRELSVQCSVFSVQCSVFSPRDLTPLPANRTGGESSMFFVEVLVQNAAIVVKVFFKA